MIDRTTADEWVGRVLGFKSSAPARPGPDPRLASQIKTLTQDIHLLRSDGRIDATPLVNDLKSAIQAVKAGSPDAAALVGRIAAAVATARSESRRAEAAGANARGINYRKLNLQWRDVRGKVAANLSQIGAILLAMPEVISDPRFAEAKSIVAQMGKFAPAFDERLEDLLDGAIDSPSTVEPKSLMKEASALIDQYRKELGAASGLLALESLAAADLGVDLKLNTLLDETLLSLKKELAAGV